MDGAIFIYVIGLPLLLFFVLLWGAILYVSCWLAVRIERLDNISNGKG